MIVCINNKVLPQLNKDRVHYLTINKHYQPLNPAIEWDKNGILIENDIGQKRYYHQLRFQSITELRQKKLQKLGC